ncbi:MAG: AAA family ATPase [Ruminococcus sp.]|nr:AAA family ATPase [Ruminococcus sp.]
MEKSGKTQIQIAKETGISGAVISQFINGTYEGDNDKIAYDLEKYLVIATERLENSDRTVFYTELRNTQTSLFAVKYAHKNCEMVLLSGDAGAGKTTALKYYTQNNTGVIFITASTCISSPTAILREIASAIGKKATGNKSQIEKTIVTALSNSNRLIIIDEADQLNFNAIQTIRNINDKAHVGILLSGNNRIYNQMVMGARCTEFDQIRTRCFVRPKVSNTYTLDEMQNIFPNVEKKGIGILLKLAERESLRMAVKLFNAVIELGVSTGNIVRASELKLVQEQFLGEIF